MMNISSKRGYVYFLVMRDPAGTEEDFGVVKVGITYGDVVFRVGQLQTGNPYDLVCFDCFETSCPREVEHFVHRDHAGDMQQREWVRCERNDIPALVDKAKAAARRFEDRKAKEQQSLSWPSNGQERRATLEEFDLHRSARKLLKELVPAELELEISENRIKAATGASLGIDGIVRVKYLPPRFSFSKNLATTLFPELAARCCRETVRGTFRWRRVPNRSQPPFSAQHLAAREACVAAEAAAATVLGSVPLAGWTARTSEMMRWHDEFLNATRTVNHLRAELADIQAQLTVSLGEYEALEAVCSLKRYRRSPIDRRAFCEAYPQEARACAILVAPQLRKFVYPTRAYL